MEKLSEFLKNKRKEKNKSLEDLERATKIRRPVLEALENERYEMLPHPSYIRGFLRLYAGEIGVNPDTVIEIYEGAITQKSKSKQGKRNGRTGQLISPFYVIIPLIIVVTVCIALLLTKLDIPYRLKPVVNENAYTLIDILPGKLEKKAMQLPSDAISSFDTAEKKQKTFPSSTVPQLPGAFSVRFQARQLVWIKIQRDNQDPFDIMLRPGQFYTLTARKIMHVRVGNAGGVSLFFNNIPLQPLGKPKEVVNITFPDAAQEYTLINNSKESH